MSKNYGFLKALFAALFAAVVTPALAQDVRMPKDFFAEQITGSSCSKFFSASRLNSDLKKISGMSSASLTSTNTLTVDHDALS